MTSHSLAMSRPTPMVSWASGSGFCCLRPAALDLPDPDLPDPDLPDPDRPAPDRPDPDRDFAAGLDRPRPDAPGPLVVGERVILLFAADCLPAVVDRVREES